MRSAHSLRLETMRLRRRLSGDTHADVEVALAIEDVPDLFIFMQVLTKGFDKHFLSA